MHESLGSSVARNKKETACYDCIISIKDESWNHATRDRDFICSDRKREEMYIRMQEDETTEEDDVKKYKTRKEPKKEENVASLFPRQTRGKSKRSHAGSTKVMY